jgi:hypothetical protein
LERETKPKNKEINVDLERETEKKIKSLKQIWKNIESKQTMKRLK